MKLKKEWVFTTLMFIVYVSLFASETITFETITFNVNKELIGNYVGSGKFNFCFYPPKSWEMLSYQKRKSIKKTLKEQDSITKPYVFFLNHKNLNSCIISYIEVDTKTKLIDIKSLVDSEISKKFPNAQIKFMPFINNKVKFLQYFIVTNDKVVIKIFFRPKEDIILEIDYIVNKSNYENVSKKIESSIGSIKLLK